jgi:hypothetical protein
MDEDRRKTLELLVELARTSDPRSCWDQGRARVLLQHQSSPAELREIGTDELVIHDLWPEEK